MAQFRLSFAITSLLLLLLVAPPIDGSATLKLQLTRYSNPSSEDWGDSCCDFLCWSKCDHIFRISLDLGSSNDDSKGSYYWTHTSGTFQDQDVNDFGADIAGVDNPLVSSFASWPGSVKFKMFVTDDDSPLTGNDDVDGLVYLLSLTPLASQSAAYWTSVVVRGLRPKDKTSLSLSYMLYCDANYYSSDCSVYCVASDSDATGHYTCDPSTGSIVCRQGYEDTSKSCKTFSNDCLVNSCTNGATCVDGVRSYTCSCRPGYTGTYCQTNVNECQSSPCLNNGTCSDLVNGYSCTCPASFVGATCAVPYCANNNPCRNGGTCYGAGSCQCTAGYTGPDCSIDRCLTVRCSNGGTCVAGTCYCPSAFTGSSCDLIYCTSEMYCLNGGSCFNGTCRCATGFTGTHCEVNVDDCQGGPCLNGGTCTDLVDGYRCTCPAAFNGPTCAVPYCQTTNPCRNGATCYGAGSCLCTPGLVGDDCSVELCKLVTCRNGGSCVAGNCTCPPGIIGDRCDIVLCDIMKCQNGGTCGPTGCACASGFTGRNCETDINDCVGDPCRNDGTCDDLVDGFRCRCLPDFTGPRCDGFINGTSNYTNVPTPAAIFVADQPSKGTNPVEAWFYASFCIIFFLLVIIIIILVVVCRRRRQYRLRLMTSSSVTESEIPDTPTPSVRTTVPNVYESAADTDSVFGDGKMAVKDKKTDVGDSHVYQTIPRKGDDSAAPVPTVPPRKMPPTGKDGVKVVIGDEFTSC